MDKQKKVEKKMKMIFGKMEKPMPKMKKCPKCKSTKSIDSFGKRKTKHVRDDKIVVVSRPQSWCQECRGNGKGKPAPKKAALKAAPKKTKVTVKPAKKPAHILTVVKNHAPKPSLKELVSGKGDAVAAAVKQQAEKKADADF